MRFAVVVGGDKKNYPADENTIGTVLNVALGRWTEVSVVRWENRPNGMYSDAALPESWKKGDGGRV